MASSAHPPSPAMDDEEAVYAYAAQLVYAAALPMTLKAAIELGLLDLIASEGPGAQVTADELAALIHARNPAAAAMIDRILRLLANYSILTCTTTAANGVRRYAAAPVCKYFTPNQDGVSLAAVQLFCNDKVSMESWYYVKETVLSGGVPFHRAHGGLTGFEYHDTDPRFSKVYNEGMRGHSGITMKKILEKYRGFDGVRVLVDVGGGVGSALSTIIAAHPQIRGINFDLPHVIAQAPPMPELLECPPEHGKVIVLDFNVPETLETSLQTQVICLLDVVMLIETPNGKERTKKEFEDLAMKSGFTGFKAILGFSGAWIMEFTK